MTPPCSSLLRTLCVLAVVAMLSACAPLTDLLGSRQPEPDIDELLYRNDFNEALELLERTHGDPAGTELQRARVQTAIAAYEASTVNEAEERVRAGRWPEAVSLLDQALVKLPDSEALRQARQEVEQERSLLIQRNLDRHLVTRAGYLLDTLRLIDRREKLEELPLSERWRRIELQRELELLAEQLLTCGEGALQRNDLILARQCLDMARDIRGKDYAAATLQRLQALERQQQAAAKAEKQAAEKAARRKRARVLKNKLHEAIKTGNLKMARATLDQLVELQGETAQLKALSGSVDHAIAARIDVLRKRASEHYQNSDFVQARALWQEILTLDPGDTDALLNIERTDQMLHKLEELQGNGTLATDPVPVTPSGAETPAPP